MCYSWERESAPFSLTCVEPNWWEIQAFWQWVGLKKVRPEMHIFSSFFDLPKNLLRKKNCEKLWMHLNTSEYIWVHLNGAEYFCILLNTFRYFSVSGSFEYIRTYLDTSGYLWVHLDTFQYIGIYFKKTNYGQKMIHCWVFFLLWYKSTCGIHQLDLAFDASIAQLRGRHHHR